jgi:AcrR family transcriptional regulator
VCTVSTRLKIAAAAREVLITEGAAAVSMRRVAATVGITPRAIYKHFADREALLKHVADAAFEDMAARFVRPRPGPVVERLHGMLDDLLDIAVQQPHLYQYVFVDARPDARMLPAEAADSPTLRIVTAALSEGMAEGTFRPGDPQRLTVTLIALVQGLIMLRHTGRIGLPVEDFRVLCHAAADDVLTGLRA